MKWKIGDEFKITDLEGTELDGYDSIGPYKVVRITKVKEFDKVLPNSEEKCLVFHEGKTRHEYYARVSCVKPITKLDRLL